eukprot:4877011-Lingulodinium_polyedra.AAC.1
MDPDLLIFIPKSGAAVAVDLAQCGKDRPPPMTPPNRGHAEDCPAQDQRHGDDSQRSQPEVIQPAHSPQPTLKRTTL